MSEIMQTMDFARRAADGKINVLELTLDELKAWLADMGEPKFRAVQLWQWLWQYMARSFSAMTNISKDFRKRLDECAYIGWPEIDRVQVSSDGTPFHFEVGQCTLDTMPLYPGRLRHGLYLLLDRHNGFYPQHGPCRNSWPDPGSQRASP